MMEASLLPLAAQAFDPDPDTMLVVQLVVQAVAMLIFGIVCAALAPGRGRSAVAWFFIGAFFSCAGLIILLLIPNLKLEEEKQRRQEAETRRLREQLRKERQVADERHEVHSQRLGVHDRALGVDTGPRPAELPDPGRAPAAAPLAEAKEWFYSVDGDQDGPVTGSELRRLWLDEEIPDRALVWRDGMDNWAPIGDVGDVLGES